MNNDQREICPECNGVGHHENPNPELAPLVCAMCFGTRTPQNEKKTVTVRRDGRIVDQYEAY